MVRNNWNIVIMILRSGLSWLVIDSGQYSKHVNRFPWKLVHAVDWLSCLVLRRNTEAVFRGNLLDAKLQFRGAGECLEKIGSRRKSLRVNGKTAEHFGGTSNQPSRYRTI